MGGLLQSGNNDLSNTANYVASLTGATLNGEQGGNLPGRISNFTLPAYNAPLGVGINQAQQDILGLNSSILQKYFGGGYNAQATGFGSTPVTPGAPSARTPFRQPYQSPVGPLIDPSTGQLAGGGTSGIGPRLPRYGFDPVTGTPIPQQPYNPTSGGFLGRTAAAFSAPGQTGVPSLTAPTNDLSAQFAAAQRQAQQNTAYLTSPFYTTGGNVGEAFGNDPASIQAMYNRNLYYGGFNPDGTPVPAGLPFSPLNQQIGEYDPSSANFALASRNGVPGYVPGFNPNDPTTWNSTNSPALSSGNPASNGYNWNPLFSGMDPYTSLPGLGITSLPGGGLPIVPGTDSVGSMLFNTAQPGNSPLQSLLGQQQNGGLSALLNLINNGNDVIGSSTGPLADAQALVKSIQSNPALTNLLNGGTNGVGQFNDIASALDTQRRTGLTRDIRDLREQFSNNGLRFSTDLANAIGQRQSESENNMNATLAQLIPQITGQSQSAQATGLNTLLQLPSLLNTIGNTSGQLKLGQQGNLISAATGAGGLAGQEAQRQTGAATSLAGNSLQALLQSPDILQKLNLLPYVLGGAGQSLAQGDLSLLSQPFNQNEAARTSADTNAVRAYQEFQRTQSLFPQLLGLLSGTPQQQQATPFSQVTGAAGDVGSLLIGAKAVQSLK